MAKVGIVTDSTSCMPQGLVDQFGIHVVPQVLNWGEESMYDGVDISSAEFYRRLETAEVMPTTSQATIAGFKDAFEELTEQGRSVVTICLSEELSGTLQSARQAKGMFPDAEITLINSETVAMALGYQVVAAAKAAEGGASHPEVVKVAEDSRARTGLLICLETLEFLHRGGRIGGAARIFGSALNIKPLIEVRDGRVEPLDRVRTSSKAQRRLLEILEERVEGKRPLWLTIHHTGVLSEVEDFAQKVREQFGPDEYHDAAISPVVGTYGGPGAYGVAYYTGS